MAEGVSATFKEDTILKLFQHHFSDEKMKLGSTALTQTTELLRIFVKEATIRAAKRALSEDSVDVTVEHFEKILPQLMLDIC